MVWYRRPPAAALLTAILTLSALASCSFKSPIAVARQSPGTGGSVTEAVVGDAGNLNPLFASEDNGRDIDNLLYQGLTTVGPDQQVRPLLAKTWTVSPDGLTYTFVIRSDVRWADGKSLSADDVVFTYGLLQDPKYTAPGGASWQDVTVSRPAPDQVRFTLRAPSASFPLSLRIGIIPRHVFHTPTVDGVHRDPHSTDSAFGTGPFMVDSISPDHRTITLKRNPHARPAPKLDQFIFQSYATLADAVQAVSAGQADAVGGLQPPQVGPLGRRPDLTVFRQRTFTFAAVLFNLAKPTPALTLPVRIALEQAIDRRALIAKVLQGQGQPAAGPIPPSDWAHAARVETGHPFDRAAAAAALDAAGWKLDPASGLRSQGGTPLKLALDTADAYPYLEVSREVAAQLRRVGVSVEILSVPAAVLIAKHLVTHDFQLAMAAFDNGPDPDQWSLWHSGQADGSLSFAGMPQQALVDKDLEDGRTTSDRKARLQIYADFQDLMAQAAPAIFLYSPLYAYAISSRVHGVHLDPVVEAGDRFVYVTDWYVNMKGT